MNEIKFYCPHCHLKMQAEPEMQGDVLDCPSCHRTIQVPDAVTASQPQPAPAAPASQVQPGRFMDDSIGNQRTMGGTAATDERSMGDVDTTGGPGSALGHVDQYELVRELGGGGFGVVYLARDTVSGIDVAVKGLPPVVKNNAEELEVIRRNFALVSKLHHPNIAAALVLHRARDVYYEQEQVRQSLRVLSGDTLMVMTYAPGVTLSKWRKQFPGGCVPVSQALDVCRQIASALDYAHAEKVVHRDIKPANIMVETRENGIGEGTSGPAELVLKVLDFGLAAEIRSSMNRVSQEKGDTSGTRPYMAPEQWAGKKQDGKTDQYALAVLFYELVSGEVPYIGAFETGDPIIMMTAVEQRAPEPLPMLSASQNTALMRALAKNPVQRYDSCSALWEELSGMQVSVEHSVKALGENGESIVKAVQTFNKAVSWISRLRIPHYLQTGREFLVELLASVPPVSRFVDRVLGVLIAPRQAWTSVQAEQATIREICKRYVFILLAISLFPAVVDAFHSNRYSTGYWTLGSGLLAVVWQYLLTMGGLYLSARLISELAPKFGATKDRENAYKLVVYSLTPVFLCTFLYYMTVFPLPYWLVWGYVAILLHWGLKVLLGVEKKKLFAFNAVSFVILLALNGSLGYFSRQAERNLSSWTEQVRRSSDKKPAAANYPQRQQVTQRPTAQRRPKSSPIPPPPSPYDNQEETYFEPSDIDADSAIPPMNLPSDIWLHPKTPCTLIQREFPSGSPTNTLVVFGLDSQAELNMFCEMMKTNGWRITKIGYGSKQQSDMLASRGLSASFAKGRKTATLIQRKDCSFELVVCGPENDSGTLDKPHDPVKRETPQLEASGLGNDKLESIQRDVNEAFTSGDLETARQKIEELKKVDAGLSEALHKKWVDKESARNAKAYCDAAQAKREDVLKQASDFAQGSEAELSDLNAKWEQAELARGVGNWDEAVSGYKAVLEQGKKLESKLVLRRDAKAQGVAAAEKCKQAWCSKARDEARAAFEQALSEVRVPGGSAKQDARTLLDRHAGAKWKVVAARLEKAGTEGDPAAEIAAWKVGADALSEAAAAAVRSLKLEAGAVHAGDESSALESTLKNVILNPPEYKKLSELFLARTSAPNTEIQNHIVNGVAAGLLAVSRGDAYVQGIKRFVADPSGLESSLNVPCPKCESSGSVTYKCASCNGSGVCKNTGCNNGKTVRPVLNGGYVQSDCIVCKGTGKCPKCQGSGTTTGYCIVCKGRKGLFSPEVAASVFVKELRAASDGFAAAREAKAGQLKASEDELEKTAEEELAKTLAVARAEILRQAEAVGEKAALKAEAEALNSMASTGR